MKKPDWPKLSKRTRELNPEVQRLTNGWLKSHPDWSGDFWFADYPPRFQGRFEVVHLNQLSDKRLEEIGELATAIGNLGLMGRKYGTRIIEYKFWLPIK